MTASTADATTYSDSLSDSNRSHTRDDTSSQEEDDGSTRLTPKWIKDFFRKEWKTYYRTAELNNKLFFHYKGFKKIENLDVFTELVCLYFEGNGITKIEGFDCNTKMKSLYLQENIIEKMENLHVMPELVQINLSDNLFRTIEGLGNNKKLDTLYIKRNKIGINGVSDLMGLLECPTLTCIDLSENRIEDEAVLEEVLVKMPNLKVLYLQGNGCTKKIKNYRKTMIARIPTLKYLDDRPVFEDDRRHAEAFARGGIEEERSERKVIKQERETRDEKNRQAFRDMIAKAREEKANKIKEQMSQEERNQVQKEVEQAINKAANVNQENAHIDAKLKHLQKQNLAVESKNNENVEDNDVTDEVPPELEEVDLEEERRKQQLLELTKDQQQKEWFDRVTKQQQQREAATEEVESEQIDTKTESNNDKQEATVIDENEKEEIDFDEMD